MIALVFLWELSLALCLFGFVVLLALVLARYVHAMLADRDQVTRQRLLPILLGSGEAMPLRGRELDVATTLTSELAELTRGSDREALLARATVMGVPLLLERRLRSRSPQVRLNTVEALALFDECGPQTLSALDDRNPDVRLGAALALVQRPDSPDAATLVRKLGVGREENSLLLVSMMADLADRDPGAIAALLFERDVPYAAKVAATDALAEAGGLYAPLLAEMAENAAGEPDLQPRLFRALGKTGHPAGSSAILGGLDSPEWPVRAAAAEAAGKARLAAAAEKLTGLLGDEYWWVRFRASEALLRLGIKGVEALRRASQGEEQRARSTATAMLAEGRAR